MEAFRVALEFCGLEDLGFTGPKFTWSNKQDDGQFVKDRLDRMVANNQWIDTYPVKRVEILSTCCSDHAPVHVWFKKRKNKRRNHF
jgi:endonuclease/exonuclease/phosphatase family metal-dependent hydrolase